MGVVYRNGDVGLFLKGLAVLFFFFFLYPSKTRGIENGFNLSFETKSAVSAFFILKRKTKNFFLFIFFLFSSRSINQNSREKWKLYWQFFE